MTAPCYIPRSRPRGAVIEVVWKFITQKHGGMKLVRDVLVVGSALYQLHSVPQLMCYTAELLFSIISNDTYLKLVLDCEKSCFISSSHSSLQIFTIQGSREVYKSCCAICKLVRRTLRVGGRQWLLHAKEYVNLLTITA